MKKLHDEMNFGEGETNKKRQEKIKNVLANSTHIHELLAKSFFKTDLAKKSNIRFKGYSLNSKFKVE